MEEFTTVSSEEERSRGNPTQIVSNWHISEFLPKKLSKYFELIILEYIFKTAEKKL